MKNVGVRGDLGGYRVGKDSEGCRMGESQGPAGQGRLLGYRIGGNSGGCRMGAAQGVAAGLTTSTSEHRVRHRAGRLEINAPFIQGHSAQLPVLGGCGGQALPRVPWIPSEGINAK